MIRFNVKDRSVRFSANTMDSLRMKVEPAVVVYSGGDPFDGSYEITPKVEAQTLPTKEKYLKEDVTIHAIPYFDVSNTAGGNTIYIGSEVLTYGN